MRLVTIKDLDKELEMNVGILEDAEVGKIILDNGVVSHHQLEQLLMKTNVINMFEDTDDVEVMRMEEMGITTMLLKTNTERCLKITLQDIDMIRL